MPRTVWKQTNPHLQGNPQWDNPTYLRGCAEEAHYEPQRKAFHIPLYIRPAETHTPTGNPSPTSTGPITASQPIDPSPPTTKTNKTASSYRLDFRNHFNQHTSRLLSHLTPDDCRGFCWKDCAIYGTSPHLTGRDHMALLDEVYNEWYPHRAEDKDISDGAFFARFMRFVFPASEATVTVGHAALFHRLLCGKLRELEGQIGLEVPVHPCAVRLDDAGGPRLAEYKLRETFERVFILLDDAEWRQRGVLLVWASERDAERHLGGVRNHLLDDGGGGNSDGQPVRIRSVCDDDSVELCIFRCPLNCAMQIVVSTDPQRAARRREWNEMLEEMLGEE